MYWPSPVSFGKFKLVAFCPSMVVMLDISRGKLALRGVEGDLVDRTTFSLRRLSKDMTQTFSLSTTIHIFHCALSRSVLLVKSSSEVDTIGVSKQVLTPRKHLRFLED
jgi:hypothetical protein